MSRNPERARLLDHWVTDHRGILVKVARAYADGAAAAADLEHEMLLQLWISTANFSGQSKESTWIYRVCLNTALLWRRGKQRHDHRIDADTSIGSLSSTGENPAEGAAKSDLLANLYDAIHALPDFDRALILLQLDELTYREIAEVTGLTENHVGVALNRARQRLLSRMKGVLHELE
jgi:RNA polymerase sigma-70 factor (ECF subfamily)